MSDACATNRSARLVGATTAVLMVAGAGLAVPAGAAPATKTGVTAGVSVAGHKTTITAMVRPQPRSGTVRFTANGRTIPGCGPVALTSGRAVCTTTFPTPGSRSVAATYSGAASTYSSSTGRLTVQTAAAPVPSKASTVVGGTGSCTVNAGALVGVSYGPWGGPIARGCATSLSTGRALLTAAGFSIAGVARFPSFICRLGNALFDGGTQYPKPAQDACANTPPASAYWSFWTAAKGVNTWTFSPSGADTDKPTNGEVEAWTFGSTDVSGTTGKPTFTPAQLRAGLPATAAIAARHAQVHLAVAGSTPDLASGADYLVGQLVDGNHYDQYGQPDLGLTIDGAFALASIGSHDGTLTKIISYVAAHQNDYTLLTGRDAAYASGGGIGKVALLAEVVGNDPRSFNGANLVAGLRTLTCAKRDSSGRCAGKGNYAYTSSTFGQALAVIAQLRAGDSAADPIAFLEGLQAASGGFSSSIPSGGSPAETDSTAMAAMALALAPGARARGALTRALAWLAGQQGADGGFPGAAGNSVNSAALSIQALRLDAETYPAQIAKGERFLASTQNGDGGFEVASGGTGGHDSDVRASAQGLGGAVGTPFASLLDDLPAKATASAGANYLVGQLVNGDHYTTSYQNPDGSTGSYDDQGLTADGVFGLLAAGGHQDSVDAMVGHLVGQAATYTGANDPKYGPYSGAAAKLALVADATGKNPDDFGGVDLLKILSRRVCTAASKDLYGPCTAKGDFVNAYSEISQALGVLALQASHRGADHLSFDSAPVVRLRQLQCSDGGFTSDLITTGATCKSEADATGYAVQALASVPGADAVLGKAQHYLEDTQRGSGLFPGAAGDNANSTAIAADGLQALVTALYSATVDAPGPKTITPITNWQSSLTGMRRLAVASGGGFGLTSNRTPDLRASTQAVLATAQLTLLSLSGATIAATPRDAAVPDPGTPSGPAGGTGHSGRVSAGNHGSAVSGNHGSAVSGNHGSAAAVSASRAADTGVRAEQLLSWAALLVALGGVLGFLGRRRIAVVIGRHRESGNVVR
ncbi:MAG: Ig-like domain repeat protein [Jatrophihabitans sp.]